MIISDINAESFFLKLNFVFICLAVLGLSCGTQELHCITWDLLYTDSLAVALSLSSCSLWAQLLLGIAGS